MHSSPEFYAHHTPASRIHSFETRERQPHFPKDLVIKERPWPPRKLELSAQLIADSAQARIDSSVGVWIWSVCVWGEGGAATCLTSALHRRVPALDAFPNGLKGRGHRL